MTCLTICQTAVRVFSPGELPSGIFAEKCAFLRAKSLRTHTDSLWKRHGRFAALMPNDPIHKHRFRFENISANGVQICHPYLRVHKPDLLGLLRTPF